MLNTEVTIEKGDGQHLTVSVGLSGVVVRENGPFVFIETANGIRGCLKEFAQPKVTSALLAQRFGAE